MMRPGAWLAAALLFALSSTVRGETFSYEIYAMQRSGKKLVSTGQRNYSRADVRVTTQVVLLKVLVTKELDLGNGFSVGFSDDGEPGTDGMGLWMHRVPAANNAGAFPGFSWEWYQRESGGIFRKLQGKGAIQVQSQRIANHEFVTRIEFRDDTLFRLSVDPTAKPGDVSHTMVIKQGSVLIFPPTGT
jgi:hypothetical protein